MSKAEGLIEQRDNSTISERTPNYHNDLDSDFTDGPECLGR